MAEQQAPAAPAPTSQGQSLTQVNHEFAQARVSRLDAAISQALASKLPPAPAANGTAKKATVSGTVSGTGTGRSRPVSSTVATTGGSASPAPTAASAPQPATSIEPSGADPELAALAAEAGTDDAGDGGDGQAQDGATEAQEWAVDRDAVTAAATKKDLRALEQALGLEEGILGATNGEHAALRRRMDAVEERERAVEATHQSNQQKLIDKFGPTCDLLTHAQKGDLVSYGRTIEVTTGLPIGKFIELWTQNVRRVDPQVLEMQRRLAQYEQGQNRPPNNASGGGAPDATQGAPTDKAAAAAAKADAYIAEQAPGHAALKLSGGAEAVRKAWLASFDKPSNSFKLTPKQAADQVVKDRRAAHEQEQWILSGKKPPKRPATKTINRTGASESQPRKENLTRDQLIERGAAMIRRQKAADAARASRR